MSGLTEMGNNDYYGKPQGICGGIVFKYHLSIKQLRHAVNKENQKYPLDIIHTCIYTEPLNATHQKIKHITPLEIAKELDNN